MGRLSTRSVVFNDEVGAVVLGSATARDWQAMFERAFAKARVIDLASWGRRPLAQHVAEMFSRIWQNML